MKKIILFEEFGNDIPNFMGIEGVEKTTPLNVGGAPLNEREKSFLKIGPSYTKYVKKDDNYYYCQDFRCENIKNVPFIIAFGNCSEDLEEDVEITKEGDNYIIKPMSDYILQIKGYDPDSEIILSSPNEVMTCLIILDILYIVEDPYCTLYENDILDIIKYNTNVVEYMMEFNLIKPLYDFCVVNQYNLCVNILDGFL
jgi:hypothetical protein